MDSAQITQIIMIILALAVAWIVLRFILKLAAKIFTCGFVVILAIGLLLFIVRTIQVVE